MNNNNNNNNNHNSDTSDGSSNMSNHQATPLSILMDVAGGRREETNTTKDNMERHPLPVAEYVGNSTANNLVHGSASADSLHMHHHLGDNNNTSATTAMGQPLELLASAAGETNVDVGATGATPPLQAMAAAPEAAAAAGAASASAMVPDAASAKSRTDTKQQRAALVKAAKALSNDPLVQLSMLRAMQQQHAAPDVVQRNKEDREKAAAVARMRKLPKKRPTPAAPRASASPTKISKHRLYDGPSRRVPAGSSVHPMRLPGNTGPQDVLMAGLNQQPHNNIVVPQASGGSDNIAGTLQFVQMLLGMMHNPNQQAIGQPMAGLQAIQGPGSLDLNAPMLDLIQNIGAGMSPQEKVALAQALIPHLSHGTSTNANAYGNGNNNNVTRRNVTSDAISSQGNGASARNSSLSPPRKDSSLPTSRKGTSQNSSPEVRIPCRARGMSSDHNFHTAHFVLPENIQHGQDLVCSFPACRDGGVKFRYCLFCRIPVAKRNFRLRHSHAEITSQPPAPEEMKIPSTISVAVDKSQEGKREATAPEADNPYYQYSSDQAVVPTEVTQEKKRAAMANSGLNPQIHHGHQQTDPQLMNLDVAPAAPVLPPPLTDTHAAAPKTSHRHHEKSRDKKKCKRKHSKRKHSERQRGEVHSKRKHSERQRGEVPKSSSRQQDRGDGANFVDDHSIHKKQRAPATQGDEKRVYMWSSLLGQRPAKDDGDNMSKWLMNVLAVSDPKAPIKAPPAPIAAPDEMSSSPSSLSLEGFDSSGQNSSDNNNNTLSHHHHHKQSALAGRGGSDSSE